MTDTRLIPISGEEVEWLSHLCVWLDNHHGARGADAVESLCARYEAGITEATVNGNHLRAACYAQLRAAFPKQNPDVEDPHA